MPEEKLLDAFWYSLNGKPIIDVKQAIKDACVGSGKVAIIGTDSQASDKRLKFVTVIVIYTEGKGGITFHTKQTMQMPVSLRQKLVTEAMLSVRVAFELEPVLPYNVDIASIHVDVNPDKKHASSKYYEEVYWMVKGQGYKVVSKPLGFVASHVAEHIVKGRPEGRSYAPKEDSNTYRGGT